MMQKHEIFLCYQILNELDTSNFDAVEEEASGDDQTSSQSSGGGTFGLTSAPHAFPDFTFKRFFDQDNQATTSAVVTAVGITAPTSVWASASMQPQSSSSNQ